VTVQWRRLSPRMLLVRPVHEVLGQLPLLIGAVVLGTATGNVLYSLGILALMVLYGIAKWFTTTYRIDADQIQRRDGVFQRTVLSVPRNRIRSVSTDARLLHRLLGLTVVKISTGQEGAGDTVFELDAVPVAEVAGLRALLVGERSPDEIAAPREQVLARWQPPWLRYSPLSFTGLATIAAAVGVIYQTGAVAALEHSEFTRAGLDAAERAGLVATVAIVVLGLLGLSVLLSVARSLFTYGNLLLSRRDDDEVLHLQHGLLRLREHTYDVARLRGGTLREPLLVRLFGGARLDAVMTGVNGAGEASLLLPPCPRATAQRVLGELTSSDVLAELRGHGPAAARRRWTKAFTIPLIVVVALGFWEWVGSVPIWLWVAFAALCAVSAGLAADRVRALGHRVDAQWLVARAGSLDRRRDCVAAAGIIGWTVRQTVFQRRAGVATLIAATAAGVKGYRILDVPADLAWAVAASASPWVAECEWVRP
jgi:putative membrane protein